MKHLETSNSPRSAITTGVGQDSFKLNVLAPMLINLRGISQKEMAKILNVPPYVMSRILKGKHHVTAQQCKIMDEALHCPQGLMANTAITAQRLISVILRGAGHVSGANSNFRANYLSEETSC